MQQRETHRRASTWSGALLWFVLMTGGALAQPLMNAPFLASRPIYVGETLTYEVRVGRVSAGEQSLQVAQEMVWNNHPVYKLISEASPSALLSRVYHFKDSKTSYVGIDNLLPLRYEKAIEDRTYRGNFVVDFDRKRNYATIKKDGNPSKSLPMPNDVHDELSMVYFLRTKDLQVGKTYNYTFFTGTTLFDVNVSVRRLEYYEAPQPLGKVKVYRLEATDGSAVWLTADRHRIPVRIEAPVKFFGKLIATLRAWSGIKGLPPSDAS